MTERFVPDHLDKLLAGTKFDVQPTGGGPEIPGLGRPLPEEVPALQKAKGLVDIVAKMRTAISSTDQSARDSAHTDLATLNRIVESALDAAGKNARLKKNQQAAVDKINDAADDLESAALEVADAKSKQALDETSLDEAVTNLRRSISIFASSVSRLATLPKESADWLNALRSMRND